MATDSEYGFFLSGHITPANCADTKELDTVLEYRQMLEKSRVFGDMGYTSAHNREVTKKHALKNGIMDRAFRNRYPRNPPSGCQKKSGYRNPNASVEHQ